jgi:hypothetical protein
LHDFWIRHQKAFDYLPSIRAFESAVKRENLTIRVYLRDRFIGGDVVNDFGRLLGLDFNEDGFSRFALEINPTPNPHELALLRFINTFKRVDYESGISDSLLAVTKDSRSPRVDVPRPWLSEGLCSLITEHYRESNNHLSANYLSHQSFQADTGRPPVFIAMDQLPEPDPMVKAMAKLYLSMFRAFHRQQHTINSLLRQQAASAPEQ